MCAIIDANIRDEVFRKTNPAGAYFYEWLTQHGRIIFGGTKLQSELGQTQSFRQAFATLQSAGRTTVVSASEVDELAEQLKALGTWASDDWHIIALAILRVNEVRILYSNDIPLHQDFQQISGISASIYSTLKRQGRRHVFDGTLQRRHKTMLKRDLCA